MLAQRACCCMIPVVAWTDPFFYPFYNLQRNLRAVLSSPAVQSSNNVAYSVQKDMVCYHDHQLLLDKYPRPFSVER